MIVAAVGNYYDLPEMAEFLQALEPEFRQVNEETKSLKIKASSESGFAGKKTKKTRSPEMLSPGRMRQQRRVRGVRNKDMVQWTWKSIFNRHLEQDYRSILDVVGWICPKTADWIRHHSRVDEILTHDWRDGGVMF